MWIGGYITGYPCHNVMTHKPTVIREKAGKGRESNWPETGFLCLESQWAWPVQEEADMSLGSGRQEKGKI